MRASRLPQQQRTEVSAFVAALDFFGGDCDCIYAALFRSRIIDSEVAINAQSISP
jgi:hypothetical protein